MRVFLVGVFVFLGSFSYGQRIINKIAGDMCDCLSNIQVEEVSSDDARDGFTNCFLQIVYYAGDLKKKGYDCMNKKDLATVAELVSGRLFKKCPQYELLISKWLNPPFDSIKANIVDSTDCLVLRNGKFMMQDKDKIYIYENSDNRQIEYDLEGNVVKEYEIVWINDCEYILKLFKTNKTETNPYFDENSELRVSVLEVENTNIKIRVQLGTIFYFGEMQKID
jgi:hypothetical protein